LDLTEAETAKAAEAVRLTAVECIEGRGKAYGPANLPITVQEQQWRGYRRLVATQGDKASVQAELYDPDTGGERYSWIYSLYVATDARREGRGLALLHRIEDEARERGLKEARMEWRAKDTPGEVLQWYLREGYQIADSEADYDGELTKVQLSKWL
jgi:GNAT superfamily N-acetyltransferase